MADGPQIVARLLAGAPAGTGSVDGLAAPWPMLIAAVQNANGTGRLAAFEAAVAGLLEGEKIWREVFACDPTADVQAGTESDPASHRPDLREHWRPLALSKLTGEESMTWILYGILAPEVITLLTGLWKAGKTTFLAHLLRALASGDSFCDLDTTAARVLVVTEESRSVWARRRDDLGLGDHVEIISRPFTTRPDTKVWEEFLGSLASVTRERKFDVVVLDSLPNLWPARDENAASDVLTALTPLYGLTSSGAAVLCVMHPRKGDANQGQATRGSGAIGGFMDVIMELRRFDPDRNDDHRRVLTGYSRFDETFSELVIDYDSESGYTAIGSKGDVRRADRLLVLLPQLPNRLPGKTVKDLIDGWPEEKAPSRSTLERDLGGAVLGGEVSVRGSGKKGEPRRYGRRGFEQNPPIDEDEGSAP